MLRRSILLPPPPPPVCCFVLRQRPATTPFFFHCPPFPTDPFPFIAPLGLFHRSFGGMRGWGGGDALTPAVGNTGLNGLYSPTSDTQFSRTGRQTPIFKPNSFVQDVCLRVSVSGGLLPECSKHFYINTSWCASAARMSLNVVNFLLFVTERLASFIDLVQYNWKNMYD